MIIAGNHTKILVYFFTIWQRSHKEKTSHKKAGAINKLGNRPKRAPNSKWSLKRKKKTLISSMLCHKVTKIINKSTGKRCFCSLLKTTKAINIKLITQAQIKIRLAKVIWGDKSAVLIDRRHNYHSKIWPFCQI